MAHAHEGRIVRPEHEQGVAREAPDVLLAAVTGDVTREVRLPPDGICLEDVEKQLLVQALDRCGGNQTHAGQLLGINRDQVRYRIEKFGLSKS